MDRFIDFVFDTTTGRVVGICLIPVVILLALMEPLVVGGSIWPKNERLRKALGV